MRDAFAVLFFISVGMLLNPRSLLAAPGLVLATLGYYSGRIDATFGPETRAAIRRYQFEIKAEMTGRLSAEQATKLVNSVR